MKKLKVLFAGMFFCLLFSLHADAQDKIDYFIGKWNILVVGTPDGDTQILLNLERKDGKLTGSVTDLQTNKEMSKLTKVEEKENSITTYFTAKGYDLFLFIEKKDDSHVIGNVFNMFDATGVRVVESK